MKVLILDVNYAHSSTGKIVLDLESGLGESGHTAMVCYGRDVQDYESSAIRIASKLEVMGHVALTRLTGTTGHFSPFATRKIIGLIDEFGPDVVHLHELHGYYVNWGEVVAHLKKRKIPTLWTFHCEFMYTGKCGYAYDCDQWKRECVRCPQLRDYPSSWLLDRTNAMFHEKKQLLQDFDLLKIVTPSNWLADRVRESFLHEKQIDVIYNGIDTENVFVPRDASELRQRLGIRSRHVIVSIGPDLMSDRKGGRWVLEVASRLAAEDITFVMVGVEQPEEISAPNVVAVPRVSDQHLLSQFYSLGDMFLLTSKKETFSLVCAESLACGTPIIGFDSGAPTEVAPSGYGKFVEYGDVQSLCSSVVYSLNNPSVFESSELCSSYARSTFGKKAMIEAYLAAYEGMSQGI